MSLFSKKETVELNVNGMHCEKCVARVESALKVVEGATKVIVDLANGSATIEGHGIDAKAAVDAVNELGFEASQK